MWEMFDGWFVMNNPEQYKVLSGVVALRSFTARELSDRSTVNLNTVKSWLRRHPDIVEKSGEKKSGVLAGRPSEVWRFREVAVERVSELLDSLWSEARGGRTILTQDDAMRAFSNSDARIRVRRHLHRAMGARDEDLRTFEISEARSWFSHEMDKIADWRSSGHEPPSALLEELEWFKCQFDALDMRIDRLVFCENLKNPVESADWIASSVRTWLAGSDRVECASRPFSPLRFDMLGDLSQQLAKALKMVEQMATLPRGRFLVSALMSLIFVDCNDVRRIICEMLMRVGAKPIGRALHDHFDEARIDVRTRRELVCVLIALSNFPRLMQNECVGGWLDSLRYSPLWADEIAIFYFNPMSHREQYVRANLTETLAPSFLRLEKLINDAPQGWRAITAGIPEVFVDGAADQISSLINEISPVYKNLSQQIEISERDSTDKLDPLTELVQFLMGRGQMTDVLHAVQP